MNLKIFNTANLFEAATNLFQQLNIKLNSNTAEPLPVKDLLKQHYKDNDTFKTIGKTYFIGIIDNTVFQATGMFDVNYSYKEALQQGDKNYDGLMLFALELSKQPTRTEISDLTRTFNRISQKMPVALVLKYKTGNEVCFSIAISERFKYKQNWRQGEKAGKVIILRDIHSETTHAGHERILLDLVKPVGVNNYDQLHQHWLQVLDVNILNKKFFQDLANWYFWAMDNVSFPDDLEKKKDVRNATNLIRLITRVVFIWFIKEKSLVPNALFNKTHLDKILKDFNKNKKSQNYYNAILQNLFFGTLNQKMEERKFAKEGDIKTNKEEYGVKNLFRYADLFNISEKDAMQLFKDVPFLNGGLFDCLDKPNEENKIVYVDGFSRNPKKQASVPDYIFFGEEKEVDLNEIYGTRNKTYKSRGLINLLESYKFTVAENTPIEEEIALDPELLGKVFENLLASYNPETQTTARKQTGSFYTPREIVNYMVDESLLEYIKQNVKNDDADFEPRLRELISYSETPNPFDEKETKALIEGINNCKILDPACGSGAFPMGILHKMVHILQKLDANNKLWKDLQRHKAIEETETAFNIGDKEERAKRLTEINDVFENNASDYGRKLYLIENCIYGIDIQPIAVQIAKLRFFISLVIDQKVNKGKENFGVRSLPNLETKFVAANTLIGLDKPAQTLLRNPDIEVKENLLKELRHKYFTANTRKEKIVLQKQDKKLRLDIAKMLESDGWQTAVAKQIVAFDPYDQNTSANWFDPEWMFGLTSGFDVVIGNPPYKEISERDEKLFFQDKYRDVLSGHYDLFIFFFKKGIDLLRKNGINSYITPHTFIIYNQFENLRKWLYNNTSILEITDRIESIFESAVVDNSISIIIKNPKGFKTRFTKYQYNGAELKQNDESILPKSEYNYEAFEIKSISNKKILKKFEVNAEPLGTAVDSSQGITVFAKVQGEKINHFRERKTTKHSKPYTKGREIFKYTHHWAGGYIEYGDWLWCPRDPKYFESPKIFLRQTASDMIATYIEGPFYAIDSVHSLIKKSTGPELKFILGILNSTLGNYLYHLLIAEEGKVFAQVKLTFLRKIPIKKATDAEQKSIIKLVDKILTAKSEDPEAETSKLEKQIDELIYKLYALSEEEINGIEGNG